ncbi:MAG: glycosyltransferase [Candidatus Hodarchaeota archaeon]
MPLGSVGGAEKFVLSLCRHHDKNRFEIMVCVLFSSGAVSDEIASEGYEVISLNMANGFDFIRALGLIRIIRNRKVDIVNIHGQNPLGKLCSILGGATVTVHTDHGVTTSSPIKRKKRVVLCNRLLSPFIDHFIAISKGMVKSLMVRGKVPREKITLIYNGVDADSLSKPSRSKEELSRELGLDPRLPVIGTVGRLSAEKQFPLLFESLSLLRARGKEFICLIIGDGPERDYLERLCLSLHLRNRVRFLGERQDVAALLGLMKVFVFSSSGEGFSITLLEAMAKALPVVAFDVEGVNEAVASEETGYLVPFGKTEVFADQIYHLLENPELAKQMGKSALERVNADFDLSKNIRKLESLYDRLLVTNRKSLAFQGFLHKIARKNHYDPNSSGETSRCVE